MTTSEFTDPETAKPEYARLHLGTAPDSWGIWFPDDPKQPHWSTFLDEVAECGFRTIELGPFGYLPTHPEQLEDELGKRGLSLTGGTVGTATHRGAEAYEQGRRDAFAVCELLAAMDVHHLVVLPEMYTDSAKTLGFRGFVAVSGPLTSRLDLVSFGWRMVLSHIPGGFSLLLWVKTMLVISDRGHHRRASAGPVAVRQSRAAGRRR